LAEVEVKGLRAAFFFSVHRDVFVSDAASKSRLFHASIQEQALDRVGTNQLDLAIRLLPARQPIRDMAWHAPMAIDPL
jgi:hypothetical protein